MSQAKLRRLARKSERGATVLVVVMVTTLITAIGVFAVRNITRIDQAAGYSRQGAQTLAVAEVGTTAALAQIAVLGAQHYADQMDRGSTCGANGTVPVGQTTTCYRMRTSEIEQSSSAKLFEPTVAGTETGSFGPAANAMGYVSIELTEKYKSSFPVPGAKVGDASYVSVTMTTTGNVRPVTAASTTCTDGAPVATSKKVMRAHTVIGPLLSSQ